MADFEVVFSIEDTFNVEFGLQGPPGPSGTGATMYDAGTTYNRGDVVFDAAGSYYGSRTDNNLNNPLTDTTNWVIFSPAAGSVTALGTLTDVTLTNVTNDQIIQFDSATSMWVNAKNSGGGQPTDNSRLGVAVAPSSIIEGAGNTTVTITLSIQNPVSGETISNQSIDSVKDPLGNDVSVTGSGNSFQFTANGDNIGNYVVRASADFTVSGTTSSHSGQAQVAVHHNWFTLLSSTQPTATTDMTSRGVWSSPSTQAFTITGADKIWIAVPNHTAGYSFTDGIVIWGFTARGAIGSDHTLYEGTDPSFMASNTPFSVTVTEL